MRWHPLFFSSRRRHTRCSRDWSSDVCSSDLDNPFPGLDQPGKLPWSLFSNDELKMGVRRFVYQDPIVEPRTFRRTDNKDARAHPDVNVLTRNVGGAAVISTVSYPRFTAVDFRMFSALEAAGRTVSGTTFADWPLDYDELEPLYAEAEARSGVAGSQGGHPVAPTAARGLP